MNQTQPISKYITSTDGGKIYADAIGDHSKQCLLFIHGFTFSAAVFNNIFSDSRYTKDFYLARYDLRGHGRSTKPITIEGHESRQYAEDFKAVMDAFQIRRPLVIGWSLGGTICADIAAHLPPDTLAGFVYLTGLPHLGPPIPFITSDYSRSIIARMHAGNDLSAMREFTDSLFADPENVPWELKAFWTGIMAQQDTKDRVFALNRKQDPGPLFELGKKGLPLLVLGARNDKLVDSAKSATIVHKHFIDMEIVWMKDGGSHAPFYDAPDEMMDKIITFVKRITVQRKPSPFADIQKAHL